MCNSFFKYIDFQITSGGKRSVKMINGVQGLIPDSFLLEMVVRVDLYQDVFHMLGFIISLPLYCLTGICTKDKHANLTL